MVPADGNFTTAIAKGNHKAGEIQGQTRQHSRLINLLGVKQTLDRQPPSKITRKVEKKEPSFCLDYLLGELPDRCSDQFVDFLFRFTPL